MLCVLGLMGCVVGNEYALRSASVEPAARGEGALTVVAQDQREEAGDVLGVQRAGVGIPYDVTTESDKPLATVTAEVVADALRKGGFTPTVQAKAGAAPRTVLVTIKTFRTDTYNSVIFDYDLTLTVQDAEGRTLAESHAAAEGEQLGGSFMNPPKHAKKAVPEAFGRVIEALINDPKVVAALSI